MLKENKYIFHMGNMKEKTKFSKEFIVLLPSVKKTCAALYLGTNA